MKWRFSLTTLVVSGSLFVGPFAYAADDQVGLENPGAWGKHTLAAYDVPLAGKGNDALAADCGVRTDTPHKSHTTSYQIHTRVESFCRSGVVSANTVSATTYRSRWYGWESRGSASAGPRATQNLRITVAIDCTPNDWHRYRTNSRGVAVINGQTVTAASYEQNDDEIQCLA